VCGVAYTRRRRYASGVRTRWSYGTPEQAVAEWVEKHGRHRIAATGDDWLKCGTCEAPLHVEDGRTAVDVLREIRQQVR
jgi:hypothetical protein